MHKKKLKLKSKIFFRVPGLRLEYIVTKVSKVRNAFIYGLLDSEDEGTTIVKTLVFTSQHKVISQITWVFIKAAVIFLNLAN